MVRLFFQNRGDVFGPVGADKIAGVIAAREISADTPVWQIGMRAWSRASAIPGLFPGITVPLDPVTPPCLDGVALTGPALAYQFCKLRSDHVLQTREPGWEFGAERNEIFDLYERKQMPLCTEKTLAWLAACPIDAKMHAFAAQLMHEQHHVAEYVKHKALFFNLLHAITSSGDGLTLATAMQVVSVHEEYTLLSHLNAERDKQQLLHEQDETYDVLTVKIDGNPVTLYFNITLPYTIDNENMAREMAARRS
jgi:hypothetical protein